MSWVNKLFMPIGKTKEEKKLEQIQQGMGYAFNELYFAVANGDYKKAKSALEAKIYDSSDQFDRGVQVTLNFFETNVVAKEI